MILIPELPWDPHQIAALVEQFCAEIGMSGEIREINSTDSVMSLSLEDGSAIHVQTPTFPSSFWRAWARLPDLTTVDLITPDVDHDSYRLAAWIAEQAFVMLDIARL